MVKGRSLSTTTNLIVEAVAIKEGIQCCIDRNLLSLYVESDSLTMINILKEKWEASWSVTMEVDVINRMREGFLIQLKHTLREGNRLADCRYIYAGKFTGSSITSKEFT